MLNIKIPTTIKNVNLIGTITSTGKPIFCQMFMNWVCLFGKNQRGLTNR
jgi:hypothetical protein